MGNKSKKSKKSKQYFSSKSGRIFWFAFNAAAIAARGLAAIALVAISIKMHPLQYQSKFFRACVEEIAETGKSMSDSVRFCNGGE